MACGIAVRMAGPLAKSKFSNPAVVVVDDAARFAISLLSGHEGGLTDWRTRSPRQPAPSLS